MKTDSHLAELIPSALLAEVEAMAAAQHRAAHDVVREAVEGYLHGHRSSVPLGPQTLGPQPRPTPEEIVARVFELRKGNVLPEGETIKDLIDFGRA